MANFLDQAPGILDESLVPFRDALKHIPIGRGRMVHAATLYRWRDKGVHIGKGRPRVKLEAIRIGGEFYTSKEAVLRFLQQINSTPDPVTAETPTQRNRRAVNAGEELERLGV